MVDGVWNYNEEPIRLRFIIRVEDERRDVGDLIRAELESAGFLIAPIYHQFAPAILTVYSTDPQLFEWHMYTEGWGRGAAERYDSATINQMAAPWLGNMPGWQESGLWQYENARLDDLGTADFPRRFPGSGGTRTRCTRRRRGSRWRNPSASGWRRSLRRSRQAQASSV